MNLPLGMTGCAQAAALTAVVGIYATSGASAAADPVASARAFAQNCFSPFMTATKAAKRFGDTGARYDFYDLDPFSNAAPSPAYGLRPATKDTDRRCEVSFDGDHAALAVEMVNAGLEAEGLAHKVVPLPKTHSARGGTELLAARRLNPNRIAVVHVGTRPGPNGIETFMNVERLIPAASQQN